MDELEQLRARLHELYEELEAATRDKWDRSLPIDELLFDRWERARQLGFGSDTSVYHTSYIYGNVEVGKHTWIGPFTILDGSGGLQIGSYCSISAGVHIYTHDTVKWAVTGGRADYERSPVSIGDCCYIGPDAVINRGTTIGDHSIVGAGSFVHDDVPPYTFAAGSPCKAIGKVIVVGSTVRIERFPTIAP
jgi:acetyltransferase-like isoleucine patch superfamily enzyme